MIGKIRKIKEIYKHGLKYINDEFYKNALQKSKNESAKTPNRTKIINDITKLFIECNYLEIGVRNPNDNFNKINAKYKTSVDPGIEFHSNPVDFKLTSDDFFEHLNLKEVKKSFDVIFIDGLHTADQVKKDIENSLTHLSPNGFIVLHDCNPPTEWHARERYEFTLSPAGKAWNGTTWKAYVDAKQKMNACCVDADWGVGILSKNIIFKNAPTLEENIFFDYSYLERNRNNLLNLKTYQEFLNELKMYTSKTALL